MGSRFPLRSNSIYRRVEEGCGDSVLLGLYPQVALKSEEGHLGWGHWARAYTFLFHSYLFWENLSNPGVAGWHISPGLNLLDKRNHAPSPCSKRKDSGETHWRNARCALEKLDCWVMTYPVGGSVGVIGWGGFENGVWVLSATSELCGCGDSLQLSEPSGQHAWKKNNYLPWRTLWELFEISIQSILNSFSFKCMEFNFSRGKERNGWENYLGGW